VKRKCSKRQNATSDRVGYTGVAFRRTDYRGLFQETERGADCGRNSLSFAAPLFDRKWTHLVTHGRSECMRIHFRWRIPDDPGALNELHRLGRDGRLYAARSASFGRSIERHPPVKAVPDNRFAVR
jgi:hypothetical protein